MAAGVSGIILDLRGNPGGYVTAARDVASQFIASGVVFSEQEADGTIDPDRGPPRRCRDRSVAAHRRPGRRRAARRPARSSPAPCRTRAGPRSSDETTFGKGTVQQWQELPGEGGAFRLTVARWLTPDGRWIHDVGITPDVAVELPDDLGPDEDPVLDRALEILGGTGRAGRLVAA